MSDPHKETEQPLLDSDQNHAQQREEEIQDTPLDRTLLQLETFLSFLGFNQSSPLSLVLSWTAFTLIGLVLPVVVLELSQCSSSDCQSYQITNFELEIVASQACLAAVSLLCCAHNLRKYGIRKFLFVDRYSGHMVRFGKEYIDKISGSVRLLVLWMLPCFILKTAREVIRMIYVDQGSWWLSIAILLSLIISWTYVSLISLSSSILFHLLCNLQVIHFDDYGKLLERESDILVFMEEHFRLRHHLSKISHRFRIFLLLQFLAVTTSQFVTLFMTTDYGGLINFINGGDFAVSSLVQVVGIILCLHAATKISHRAQGIGSVASRWHALATCSSTEGSQMRTWHALATCSSTEGSQMRTSNSTGNLEASQMRTSNSMGSLEAANTLNTPNIDYSESDVESLEYIGIPTNTHLASYLSSYHRRQAFVTYLQTNPGGITIFGWTVDRALITTIFFIELSLITFVLGKTIVT